MRFIIILSLQKSYILSQLKGEYEDIKDIVVLTTYLIQGRA